MEKEMPEATSVKPVRLQRSRRKGAKLVSPNGLPVVCVTRPGKWGNPFKVGDEIRYTGEKHSRKIADAEEAVEHYRDYLNWVRIHEPQRLLEIRGKNLACWCKIGDFCHADVLLEYANEEPLNREANN